MNRTGWILLAAIVGVLCLIACTLNVGVGMTEEEVKAAARRATVQVATLHPVIYAKWSDKLPSQDMMDKERLDEVMSAKLESLEKKLTEAMKQMVDKAGESRHNTMPYTVEVWGYKPPSSTAIPLGAIAPAGAKFLERVLVVAKVKKTEISPIAEYEKDILAISETADVSPSKAKEILSKLKSEGYSINKTEIEKAEEVKLLHFPSDWNSYPATLDWTVEVEGERVNMIRDYDPRGILIVKPIPQDDKGDLRRVHVRAAVYTLKDEFSKSGAVKDLEKQIEKLKEEKADIEKRLKEKDKIVSKVEKRKISKATWNDVRMGYVEIKQFWLAQAASGIFLGNLPTGKTWGASYGFAVKSSERDTSALILTNAHVAALAMESEMMVSDDEEEMYIIMEGEPYVRFTDRSDTMGSPAFVLTIDGLPVYSRDIDTALLVTSAVPDYEQHRASLGDSSDVREGDRVVLVGNPAGLQKFTSCGVVANTNFSILDSLNGHRFLKSIKDKQTYAWLRNSNWWFDTPIGVGGTSGSGVWAMGGKQAGKVVALHNMGLGFARSYASMSDDGVKVNYKEMWKSGELMDTKGMRDVLFSDYPFHKATFGLSDQDMAKRHPVFSERQGGMISGLNGAIPINEVKRYMQERGIDPKAFGFKGLDKRYWER